MYLGQDTDAVFENLIRRRDKLSGHEKLRIVLMALPGGMRGVYGAGQQLGLELQGFNHCFHSILGISTGAWPSALLLAGQMQKSIHLYWTKLATRNFVNLLRRPVVDISMLVRLFRAGEYALDVQAVLDSPTDFYVGVSTLDGKSRIINAKTATPDLIEALHGSSALPGELYGVRPIVNGERVVDGGTNPFPIEWVIENLHPTDILVIPNRVKLPIALHREPWGQRLRGVPNRVMEMLIRQFVLRDSPRRFQIVARHARNRFVWGTELIDRVRHIRIGILPPADYSISAYSINARRLQKAALQAAATVSLISDAAQKSIQSHPDLDRLSDIFRRALRLAQQERARQKGGTPHSQGPHS